MPEKHTAQRRIVAVTGVPRSGTTVVGDILGARAGSVSIYEPMNPQSGDKRFKTPFPVPGSTGFCADDLNAFLHDLRVPRLDLRSGVFPHETGIKALIKRVVGGRSRASLRGAILRPRADTLIWKDPFALLCVPALIDLGVDVVVTYRPAPAIAASFKRLNWQFPIEAVDARLREAMPGQWPDPPEPRPWGVSREAECAVHLWKLCAAMCLTLEPGKRPLLVSTGDLSAAPRHAFEGIFAHLGMTLDAGADREIARRFRGGAEAAIPTGHPHTRSRDLGQVNDYWREILCREEIDYVTAETAHLAPTIERCLYRPAPPADGAGATHGGPDRGPVA